MSWWTALQRYVDTRDVKDMKEAINKAAFLKALDEEETVLLHDFGNMEPWERFKALPVNRRRRKRLGTHDAVVLDLDRIKGDLPEEELWKVLLKYGRRWRGRFQLWCCRTWPAVSRNIVKTNPLGRRCTTTLARFRKKISGGRIETALVLEKPASKKVGATWAADGSYQSFVEEAGIEGWPVRRLGEPMFSTVTSRLNAPVLSA